MPFSQHQFISISVVSGNEISKYQHCFNQINSLAVLALHAQIIGRVRFIEHLSTCYISHNQQPPFSFPVRRRFDGSEDDLVGNSSLLSTHSVYIINTSAIIYTSSLNFESDTMVRRRSHLIITYLWLFGGNGQEEVNSYRSDNRHSYAQIHRRSAQA